MFKIGFRSLYIIIKYTTRRQSSLWKAHWHFKCKNKFIYTGGQYWLFERWEYPPRTSARSHFPPVDYINITRKKNPCVRIYKSHKIIIINRIRWKSIWATRNQSVQTVPKWPSPRLFSFFQTCLVDRLSSFNSFEK